MRQGPCGRNVGEVTPEFNTKYSRVIDCVFIHVDPCIVIIKSLVKLPLDSAGHRKSNHLERKQAFLGKVLKVFFVSLIYRRNVYAAIFLTVDQL